MPSAAGFGLLIRAAQLASRIDAALVVLVDTPGADPHTEAAGLAASIAEAMTAVLECRSPTVALVHGAGGSGGALAGAVTDLVGVGPHGWFAALAPEGAAAALRRDLPEVTDLMHVTPADLISQGFADTFVPTERIAEWLSAGLVELRARPVNARLRHRYERWSHGLPESS
jgi:acetyl-CoA carboxylase carboxyl transferase subunit beta